jgi:LDH2 family malate/lactate/ureidoglycolate dehydrogenase
MEVEALKDLAARILVKHGVEPDVAGMVADVLVDADARGVVSHGLTRLPAYVERVRAGVLAPNARPAIVADNGALLLLDGGNGFGAVAGIEAADLAMERAREHGCAWVIVRASNHLSMLGYYTRRISGEGMAAICITNAGPSMAAWGGKRPVVGTNPISMSLPGTQTPVVADMAVSTVARGKIRRALSEGRPIPEGWGLDAAGCPTTDPEIAMQGTVAPMGAHKGFALSAMIDLMTGVLANGHFATGVRTATDLSGVSGVCFCVIAANVASLPDADGYMERLRAFRSEVEASAADPAVVHLPGDIEDQRAREADRDGIELPPDVMQALKGLLAD